MRFSYDWLAEYVELPAPKEVGTFLTGVGHAVEGVEAHGDDTLLDLEITTNRPDCMCHRGLARELAVLTEGSLPELAIELEPQGEPASADARVVVEEPDHCLRFVGLVLRDVEVGPSPPWLRERLESIGHRSINNVVDVTNFVLWETGKPLHAYDLETLGRVSGTDDRVDVRGSLRRRRRGASHPRR